jgi:phage shock protein B
VRFLIKLAGAFVFLLLVLAVGSMVLSIVLPSARHRAQSPQETIMLPEVDAYDQTGLIYTETPQDTGWATAGIVILAGSGVLLLGLVVGLIAAMKFFAGGQRTLRRDPDQLNETLMIQEIHAGLSRMEDRIEALETILFDRAAPSGHPRPKAGRPL